MSLNKAVAIDDVSGFKVKHKKLRKQWDGFMTNPTDYDEKHPLLEPNSRGGDRETLVPDPRPDRDIIPSLFGLPIASSCMSSAGSMTVEIG